MNTWFLVNRHEQLDRLQHGDGKLPSRQSGKVPIYFRPRSHGSDLHHRLNFSFTLAVAAKLTQRLVDLSAGDVSAVIQMAWEDRTSFETIRERVGLVESEVIRLMRQELTANSFRMWRMRMKGRITKHRALRSPDMKFEDRLVADHRRANC